MIELIGSTITVKGKVTWVLFLVWANFSLSFALFSKHPHLRAYFIKHTTLRNRPFKQALLNLKSDAKIGLDRFKVNNFILKLWRWFLEEKISFWDPPSIKSRLDVVSLSLSLSLSLSIFCQFLLLFLSCLFVLPIFVFSFESFCLFQLLFLQFFAFLFVWFWTILLFYHFFPFVHLLLTLCIRCNLYYFLVFPLPLVLAIIQLIFFLLWLYPRVIYFSTS